MKYIRLNKPGSVLKTSQHSKCAWCEYGTDPGKEGICVNCYAAFKRLLRTHRWERMRTLRFSTFDTAHCMNVFNFHPSGVLIPAYIMDHIEPWRFKPSLFWEESNHQGLCHSCHNHKSRIDGSFDNSPMPFN